MRDVIESGGWAVAEKQCHYGSMGFPSVVETVVFPELCFKHLVATYCAIPRDYLNDTPLLRAMGVFCVSTLPIGCDIPRGEHAKWRCDTPPLERGISAILAQYPLKTKQMGAIPPSATLYLERVLRGMGGYLALGRCASNN